MKRFILHLPCLALLFVAALGLVSCSEVQEDVRDKEEDRYATFLKVSVRVMGDEYYGATRAVGPDGGDTGNATESGIYNENKVYNVTLLLYRDANGINSDADPAMEYAFYAPIMHQENGSGGKVYTSDELRYKSALPSGAYHAIALVNMGDRTDLEGKTLSEVRDMQVGTPYNLRYNATTGMPYTTEADNFVMTSARDVSLVLGSNFGINNPVNVQIPVARLAARLDFSPGKVAATLPDDGSCASWVEGEVVNVEEEGFAAPMPLTGYKYVVLNASTKAPTKDRFILTDVTPFNCLTSGTYYIKRVRDDIEGGGTELVYLGEEKMDASKNATNSVLDPWTVAKNSTTDPVGLAYRNRLTNAYTSLDKAERWPVKKDADVPAPSVVPETGLDYYILDYTQENTLPPGYGKERYATGLLMSGYYGSADAEGHIEKYIPQSYHYYVRHADPANSADESLPMKYGIVRNNIYRIHVNSVNSRGQIQIVVNDWKRIEVPEIQL